jgi:multidrug efflux pump subunit AcrA (membrane-fusion protein)
VKIIGSCGRSFFGIVPLTTYSDWLDVTLTPATSSTRRTLCLAALAVFTGVAAPALSHADEPKSPDIVTAITRPSKTAKAAFAAPGIVMDVKVVEGQPVKKGDVLAVQDDRQDESTLESMKLDAASTAEIDYSVIDLGVKKVQYDRQLTSLN